MNDQISQTNKPLRQKKITGNQMRRIIEMCGKNCPQFAQFLGKSDNFVYQSLGYIGTFIPFTYYDALEMFVGEENFLCALRELEVEP